MRYLLPLILLPGLLHAQAPVLESKIHDRKRPQPPPAEPKPLAELDTKAPPGAVMVFDGTNLDGFMDCGWTLKDGYFESSRTDGKKPGDAVSARAFGDGHYHFEWSIQKEGWGNSGVFLHGLYEIQVLNSFRNAMKIYADGQAAGIYGQYPPAVNACRPQGEWEVFDIRFTAPRFKPDGSLEAPARVTAHHNGLLVHDDVPLTGPTAHKKRPSYSKTPLKLPFRLQDHGDVVKFRNIWVLEK